MSDEELTEDHIEAKQAREAATRAVLLDPSHKKVVVAGPGTGKTHLFKEIFASKEGTDKLTLTFINALVEDLSLELHGASDVKTLHSYALSRFSEGKVKIFPGVPEIIRDDGKVLLGEDVPFVDKIHEIDNSDGHLDFYSERRQYYGHFGYSDIILGLVRLFERMPEKIPTYAQIVVDEFQDFNELEVTLIELLSTKSPVVIAGDDDQALYEFKRAHPKHIRELHGLERPDFASFSLPFCSRSTKVIVDAVNDLVFAAMQRGFLEGRVEKPYRYFACPEKDKESTDEPKIIHKRLEDGQIAWFIAEEMNDIARQRRKKFDVLIISPYIAQCEKIGRALTGKGFTKVEYRTGEDDALSYLDGLRLLAKVRVGHKSNLGWRIAGRFKLTEEQFSDALKGSMKDDPPPFRSLVPLDAREVIERDVAWLQKIRNREDIDSADLDTLLKSLSMDQNEIKTDFVRDKLLSGRRPPPGYQGIKKIPITGTTIPSSKGLAAEYVFITHFDQRYLPGKDGITDQQICNILVALTRARKKVWLLSTTDESSEFLGWVGEDRVRVE